MSKVYILNNGGHDYSAAQEFGSPVICTEGVVDKKDTAQMFRLLSDALEYAQETDYILITSLTSLCCIAVGIMADRFGKVNLLIYEGGRYLPRTIVFSIVE